MVIFPASHAVTRARDADAGGKPLSGGGVIGAAVGSRTTRSYPGIRGSASVGGTSESAPTFTAAGTTRAYGGAVSRSEEHTSELQSHHDLVCRLLLEKKKNNEKK